MSALGNVLRSAARNVDAGNTNDPLMSAARHLFGVQHVRLWHTYLSDPVNWPPEYRALGFLFMAAVADAEEE